ncbi:MAG: radical SAM family heme chaperone HemW [Phycisphaerae bacterium]
MEPAFQEKPASRAAVGWYAHLPFCQTKCGYCDFYSLPTIPRLIDGLVRAIERDLVRNDPARPVESVFIGGGTPTELPTEALDALVEAIGARAGAVQEWTVEANPTSAGPHGLEHLRSRGVNRMSFGAQSFHADDLRVLERLHDPRHIAESVLAARAAGFDNINIDLIYAVPGQNLTRWRDSLRRAIDLDIEHLSCYALMYEPGTSLTRAQHEGRVAACDEGLEADMFETTIEELTSAGFDHYEISNYARPNRRCRANLIYWENREYLGLGPSAVSYLNGVRRKNIADVRQYIERIQADPAAVVVEAERLSPRQRASETAVQMLRLIRGIDVAGFRRQTGYDPLGLFAEPIARFAGLGLLETDRQFIRLTRRGLLLANRVMADFLPDEPGQAPTP